MDAKTVKTISSKVYKKFPEVDGKSPKIKAQRTNGTAQKKSANSQVYLLTYRGTGKGPGGKSIPRYVRVTANQTGKIIKISTSRG
ncbi:MAG: hypothetical protein R3335_15095 [Anaerolineales bacterium]|nr:hypothetical protein [Anaerolineales bacterium]